MAKLNRDLLAYAEALARETGRAIADPLKLGQRFLGSNHIRQPRRVCRTMCG